MNPHSSTSRRIGKKFSPAPASSPNCSDSRQRKRPMLESRNPLKDMNTIASTTSSNASSSISVEAPRGCLSFFSSSNCSRIHAHGRPKTALARTPQSAPNTRVSKGSRSKPSKENLPQPISHISEKSKKHSPFLYQWQSGRKKPSSRMSQKANPFPVFRYDSDSLPADVSCNQQNQELGDDVCGTPDLRPSPFEDGGVAECTPAMGESLSTKHTKTPPVEASVSPEIQQSSVSFAKTPTCYGAGHVLSGVSDKRKCKPRGILAAEERVLDFNISDSFESEEDGNVMKGSSGNARDSIVPSPAEASMRWLLSPCNEEDENQKNNSANSSSEGQRRSWSQISLLSRSEFPKFGGFLMPQTECDAESSSLPSSPPCTPSCNAIITREGREDQLNLDGESSPFSVDSLGSENVMLTPQSDSSSGRRILSSSMNVDDHVNSGFEAEIDSVAEVLQKTSLSSQSQLSMWDSVGGSFQFCHAATPSNSLDSTRYHEPGGYEGSLVSHSSLNSIPRSQMNVSWREGLASRIFEMDEVDLCRCLSDEEEDAKVPSCEPKVDLKDKQVLGTEVERPEFFHNEPGLHETSKEELASHRETSYAESICTDGGSLVASGDSDWNVCYKNQIFKD